MIPRYFCPLFLALFIHTARLSCSAQDTHPPAAISTAVTPIRTFNLQETEDYVITTITRAEFSPNGTMLAIVDHGSGNLLLYETRTGTILKSVAPGPELTDSLVYRIRPFMMDGIIPLSHDDVGSGAYPIDYTHNIFRNHFTGCSFLSDSTIGIYGLIKPALWNSARHTGIVGLDAAAVLYDLHSDQMRLVPIGSNESSRSTNPTNHYPQSWTFLYDRYRSDFITSASYLRPNGRLDLDSTRYLARYSLTGRRTANYLPIPPEIRRADITHTLHRVSAAVSDNGDILAVVDIIPRIYNVTRGTSFDITGLGANNEEFFRMAENGRLNLDSLVGYLRVRIPNIAVTARNTLIIPVAYIVSQGSGRAERWHLCEYTMEGRLLRSMELSGAEPDATVRYAGYSNADDAVFVMSLSNETGWWISLLR